MRKGYNPHKDALIEGSEYTHQVIVPVYIPSLEGYFAESLAVLRLCLESLFRTVHEKTFISVVDNGSCRDVADVLDAYFREGKIREVIHTENIGKVNAILKGLAGNPIELVTITDADVLFVPGWQSVTADVFNALPRAGIVGLIPQFKMYEMNCGNLLADRLFTDRLRFIPVADPEAMRRFYESIGWKPNYNPDYLRYALGLVENGVTVYVGNGHVVATYRKDIFTQMRSYLGYKLGGDSEQYLDAASLRKGYWNVTTADNLAFHMGNTLESWMEVPVADSAGVPGLNPVTRTETSRFCHWLKNRLLPRLLISGKGNRWFLRMKKLPPSMIARY